MERDDLRWRKQLLTGVGDPRHFVGKWLRGWCPDLSLHRRPSWLYRETWGASRWLQSRNRSKYPQAKKCFVVLSRQVIEETRMTHVLNAFLIYRDNAAWRKGAPDSCRGAGGHHVVWGGAQDTDAGGQNSSTDSGVCVCVFLGFVGDSSVLMWPARLLETGRCIRRLKVQPWAFWAVSNDVTPMNKFDSAKFLARSKALHPCSDRFVCNLPKYQNYLTT